MKSILTKAEGETRDLTAEENGKFDELNKRAESITVNIQKMETVYDHEQRSQGDPKPGRDPIQTPEQNADQRVAEQRAEFGKFLRGVVAPEEVRALTVSGQGVVGHREFYNQLVSAMKSYAGVRQAGATVLTTSNGNEFTVPTADDTDNTARIVAEATENTNVTEPTLGIKTLRAYRFDSDWIKVSQELLQDADYPIESEILRMASERIGRKFNTSTTLDDGSGKPEGFMHVITAGVESDFNVLKYEDLIDLYHSVDSSYRGSARWMLNDQTMAKVRKLRDWDGAYIFAAGAAGIDATILGAPYVINNDMPDAEDDEAPIAYGDWSRYFCRDVTQVYVVRANELFISDGLIGFKVISRHDGKLIDAHAVKALELGDSAPGSD